MSRIKVFRGTDHVINFSYTNSDGTARSLSSATVRFTVKDVEYDSDAADTTAQITKNVTTHVDDAAGTSQIVLTDTDTYIDPGNYYYDIKVEESDGRIYKAKEGRFKVDGSPTNRTS